MRSEEEIINGIKNDLRRVSKWACRMESPLPWAQIDMFLKHAKQGLAGLVGEKNAGLKKELDSLIRQREGIKKFELERLRWAEKVLTLGCRL